MTYVKYLTLAAVLLTLTGGTCLLIESESNGCMECERKLAALDREFMEASIGRSDCEHESMLHDRTIKEIDTCLKLESVEAIRECATPHIVFSERYKSAK